MAKTYQGKKRHRVQRAHGKTERDMVRSLDKLAEFEEFADNILPVLRRDLKNDMGPEDMQKKYAAIATARLITLITTSTNEPSVLGAIKDLLDRVQGKPLAKEEVTHKLEKLKDEEMDAILASELLEAGITGGDDSDK